MPPGTYRLVKHEHWSHKDSSWSVASGVLTVLGP
jgi:hypothetical protein